MAEERPQVGRGTREVARPCEMARPREDLGEAESRHAVGARVARRGASRLSACSLLTLLSSAAIWAAWPRLVLLTGHAGGPRYAYLVRVEWRRNTFRIR